MFHERREADLVTGGARASAALGRWRDRREVQNGLLVIGAVVFGALLGRSIANGQIMIAGLVAGFILVVALAQKPWLPYVACAALVATFATPSSLPQFGIPGNPTLSDLVLVAAFVSWLLILSRGAAERPSEFPLAPQLALGVFLVAAVLGIIVGSANGATSPLVDARDIAYYATFWLALTVFVDGRREFVLRIAAFGAVAIVVAQVAQGFLGLDYLLFYDQVPLRELIRCPSGGCADPRAEGFPRVRPPGLVLVYVTACFSASYLLWGPPRRRRRAFALLAVCMIGLFVSLNRNMLIGLIAGLLLAGLLAARRGRFVAVATVVFVVGIASFEVARASRELEGNSIVARVLSITATSELESSDTVKLRLLENDRALRALSISPIEGLGWGVPYGPPKMEWEDGEFRTKTKLFIHNQYLGLWLRTGLVGLASFVAALVLAVVYGSRWLRSRADQDDAWLGAGVIASVTAIAVSSIVAIYIIHPSWAPILAGLMALATNLERDLAGDR